MQFIKDYPFLIIAILFLAVFFFLVKKKIDQAGNIFADVLEKKITLKILAGLLIVQYIFGYLMQTVIYTDYFYGTCGDNYRYVFHALNNPLYFNPQHILYPLLGGIFVPLLEKLAFFIPGTSGYTESLFVFFALPLKIFAGFGLWAMYVLLRISGLPKGKALTGTLFFSVTFAYWFWNIQPNARGLLMPLYLFIMIVSVKAVADGTWRYYLLAAFLGITAVFIHIASAYFVVASGIFLAFFSVYRCQFLKSPGRLFRLAVYLLIAVSGGWLFYYFCSRALNVYYIPRILEMLSDPGMFGKFSFGPQFFTLLFRDGISTNLSMLFGLLYGKNKQIWELVLITLIFSMFFFQALSFFRIRIHSKDNESLSLILNLLAFACIMTGFSLRKTWPEYFASIIPVSASLYILLLFKNPHGNRNIFLLPVIIISVFIMNTAGSNKVLSVTDLYGDETYSAIHLLGSSAATNESVVYFGKIGPYRYNHDGIYQYYCKNPKSIYSGIHWENNLPDAKELFRQVYSGKTIAVNLANYPEITGQVPADLKISVVSSDKDNLKIAFFRKK